ncbi:MAG: FecR family protein [candidate division FCPU426 bacterium]
MTAMVAAILLPRQTDAVPSPDDQNAVGAVIYVSFGPMTSIERDGKEIKPVKRGMQLLERDVVKTLDAQVQIMLNDGSVVRLNKNTTLELKPKNKDKQNRLKLLIGHLWAKIKKQDTGLEIETPSAVAAIKGTELELKVLEKLLVQLLVWDGLIRFYNDQGQQLVGPSFRSTAGPGSGPSEPEKINLEDLPRWFESVVDNPSVRTLKTTVRDKDGKEYQLNLKYQQGQ